MLSSLRVRGGYLFCLPLNLSLLNLSIYLASLNRFLFKIICFDNNEIWHNLIVYTSHHWRRQKIDDQRNARWLLASNRYTMCGGGGGGTYHTYIVVKGVKIMVCSLCISVHYNYLYIYIWRQHTHTHIFVKWLWSNAVLLNINLFNLIYVKRVLLMYF